MKLAPSNLRTRRAGFTLIELLVAAALCVVIMTVLAISFRSGMDTMSQMKSVADMTDHLRAAEVVIINDLQTPHLEDDAGLTVSLSDPIVNRKWDGTNRRWESPRKGFFRITQGSAPKTAPGSGACPIGGLTAGAATDAYLWEGTADNVNTFRAHDHWMHFTMKKTGLSEQESFTVDVPNVVAIDLALKNGLVPAGNKMTSNWAEVAYFLAPTSQYTAGANSFPLYTLYRRQRAIAQTAPSSAITVPAGFVDLSVTPSSNLNTPQTITNLVNRLFGAGAPTQLGGADVGKDVLLSNVISFQIQVMTDGNNEFRDLYDDGVLGPTGDTQPWPRTWDSANQPATATRIRGVQIHIRVYDIRNAITRQMTITQAL